MSIDTSNRCCLYYLKDKHKIAKISFENSGKNYDIQKMYSPLINTSNGNFLIILFNFRLLNICITI